MNTDQVPFEPGAAVEASNGRLGTVDDVSVEPETGKLRHIIVRRGWTNERLVLPADLVEEVADRNHVRLRITREEAAEVGRRPEAVPATLGREDEVRVPIVEERLQAEKRLVETGELRIQRRVEETEERARQPVMREEVEVERVKVGRFVDAPPQVRTEGDTLVVPVYEEVLVVQKRLRLTEEIRITRRQRVEDQEVRAVLRRQQVDLEDATPDGVRTAGADDRG